MFSTDVTLGRGRATYPFLSVEIVVGDFLLGEDEQPLLVVERGGHLLLLRAFDEDLLQDGLRHGSGGRNLRGFGGNSEPWGRSGAVFHV